MSDVVHNAIIVTSNKPEDLRLAREAATFLFGDQVSEIVDGIVNGYSSFFVAPHGSGLCWPEERDQEQLRERFRQRLAGSMLAWIEVAFDFDAAHVRHGSHE